MKQCFFIIFFGSILATNSFAKLIHPNDDDLLARVSTHSSARDQLKLRQLRMMLDRDPKNLGAASELGSIYLALAQRTGKSEFYGMAESAVSGWTSEQEVPPDIKLIRSAIHRFEHEFAEGLEELNGFLKNDSTRTDVLMSRSILHGVMGNYKEAAEDCEQIKKLHAPDLNLLCLSQITFFLGKFPEVEAKLNEVIPSLGVGLLAWAEELRAASKAYAGNTEAALSEFVALRKKNGLSPAGDMQLIDILIERKQWAEARQILTEIPESIGTLLRYALIQKLSQTEGREVEKMSSLIASMTIEDQKKHSRELAQFYLLVVGNTDKAAEFAKLNYSFQKEPFDARLLVQSSPIQEREVLLGNMKSSGIDTSYVERPF